MSVNKTELLKQIVETTFEEDYWDSLCSKGKDLIKRAAKATGVDISTYVETPRVYLNLETECFDVVDEVEVEDLSLENFEVAVTVKYNGKVIYTGNGENIDINQ